MNNTHTQGNKPLNTPWGIRIAGACRAEPEQQINWFYCLIVPGREEKLIHNDSINSVADLLAKSTIHTLSFLFFLARSLSLAPLSRRTRKMYNTHNTLWIQMGLNQTDLRVHCNILTKMPKRMPNSVDSSVTTVWTLISNWHQIVQSYGFKQQVRTITTCMYVLRYVCRQ